MRKLCAFLVLVLAFSFMGTFAQTPPAIQTSLLGAQVFCNKEGVPQKPLEIGDIATCTVLTLYQTFDGVDTYNQYDVPNFIGLEARSSDEAVLEIAPNAPAGTIELRGRTPGVATIYFTIASNSVENAGKLPPMLDSRQAITVYNRNEDSDTRDTEVLLYPENDFVRLGGTLQLNLVSLEKYDILADRIAISTLTPSGKTEIMVLRAWVEGELMILKPGKPRALALIDTDPQMLVGRYKAGVVIYDNNGKIIGQNRFSYTIGQYNFPGSVTEPKIQFASNYSLEGKPDRRLAVYGIFPSHTGAQDVQVLVDGVDWTRTMRTRWGTVDQVTNHDSYVVELNVTGRKLVSADHDVLLFFKNTGQVFFKNRAWQVIYNEDDQVPWPFNRDGNQNATQAIRPN